MTLVMQGAMRAVLRVWPGVTITNLCDKKLHVQATKAEDATQAARTVYEKLKNMFH